MLAPQRTFWNDTKAGLERSGRAAIIVLAIVAALLTFPAAVPWMVAACGSPGSRYRSRAAAAVTCRWLVAVSRY